MFLQIKIGNGIESIGYGAFSGCTGLTDIYINKSENSISGSPWGAPNSSTIHWNSTGPEEEPDDPEGEASEGLEFELNDDGQSYYVKGIGTCQDTDIVVPSSYNGLPVTAIGIEYGDESNKGGFVHCYNITSVVIPDSVTTIGGTAFGHCESLTSVTIPDSVTYIGWNAFWNCPSLMSITIPNSVTYIGSEAFMSSSDIKLIFNGTVEQWNKIDIDSFGIASEGTIVYCTDGEIELEGAGLLPIG